ncbi:MAG: FtsX-like permease family protein [Cytophagales bacterium]|nr:FtsX-like permease family protein [Cytophagales bacterium]
MKSVDPPRILEKFFAWFCHELHQEGLEGDLYQLFEERVEEKGPFLARWYYFMDMVSLLRSSVSRPLFKNSKSTQMDLLKHYLKASFRFARRKSVISSINLFGLLLGITSVTLIAIYVNDEAAYDQFIPGHEDKYRVYLRNYGLEGEFQKSVAMVPPIFTPFVTENYPDVEKMGRVFFDYGGTLFQVGDKKFSEKQGVYAELAAMEILDYQLVEGDFDRLNEPNTMLVSETLYKKFFGEAPFEFQTVKLTRSSMQIVGVFEDRPGQTHLKVDYIFSFQLLTKYVPDHRMKSWRWQQFFTYVQLKKGVDPEPLFESIRAGIASQSNEITEKVGFTYRPTFQSLADIHLHSKGFDFDIAEVSDYQAVIFLLISAIIILLVAAFNYINLTTAQALYRNKDISVRKFVGAKRKQLMGQYVLESIMYCSLAGLVSLGVVALLLPYFNNFTNKSFELFDIVSLESGLLFVGFIMLLGGVSGWYPALLITKISPLDSLRGQVRLTRNRSRWAVLSLKNSLVGLQYVLCTALIITSLIIQDQYDYLRNTDMGFEKENLLYIPITRSMRSDLEAAKATLSEHSNITHASLCYGIPGSMVAGDGVVLPKVGPNEFNTRMFIVDANYIETMGMRMIAGRGFSPDLESDVQDAFVINETAVKDFGFANAEAAVGEPMNWKMWREEDTVKRGRIIGVVDDFNFNSLHNPVEKAVLHIDRDNFSYILLRLGKGDYRETIAHLETAYRKLEPVRPLEFELVDQQFAQMYESEERLSKIFSIYTSIAILAAAIGLLGLVSHSVTRRSKEINIRKVLGASQQTILSILATNYFRLVAVSLLFAVPLAYYVAELWLETFAFSVGITPWVFVKVSVFVFLITGITIAYHTFKGATTNPADRLRME